MCPSEKNGSQQIIVPSYKFCFEDGLYVSKCHNF